MPGEINVVSAATVLVTSEDPEHPVDQAFDSHRGLGGTRWIAGEPGEQTVIVAFDAPEAVEPSRSWRLKSRKWSARRNSSWPSPATAAGPIGMYSGGIQLQSPRDNVREGGLGGVGSGGDSPAAPGQAGQGGQALPSDPHLVGGFAR